MTITREDILALPDLFGQKVDLSGFNFTDRVHLSMATPFGKLVLEMKAEAIEGEIEVNITHATFDGIGAFGAIRSKAAEVLLAHLRPYADYVKAWKHTNGNLRFSVSGLKFETLTINQTAILLFAEH